jgi:hypothetical protein
VCVLTLRMSVFVWHQSLLSGLTLRRRKRNARQRLLRQTGIGLVPPRLATALAMAGSHVVLVARVVYRSRSDSGREAQQLVMQCRQELELAGALLHLEWRCHMAHHRLASTCRRGDPTKQRNSVDGQAFVSFTVGIHGSK